MGYSIKAILHNYKDASDLQKIQFQVIFDRKKIYIKTPLKITLNCFVDGKVVNHPHKLKMNNIIASLANELDGKLLDALKFQDTLTITELTQVCRGKMRSVETKVTDYFTELQTVLKGELSDGRLKHYNVCKIKIDNYNPRLTFRDIDDNFPKKMEQFIRKTGVNGATIASNMSVIKAAFKRAFKDKLLTEDPFTRYDMPRVEDADTEYLTTAEVSAFRGITEALGEGALKRAGYYFLLSCYFGYRLNDSLAFDYNERVKDDSVVLRAKKNGKIVSMPTYDLAKPILEFVKDNPINLSEDKVRQYVYEIAKLAGIKRKITFHTSRHSFAMFLTSLKFSQREVASKLGDTVKIAERYIHISDNAFNEAFLKKVNNI